MAFDYSSGGLLIAIATGWLVIYAVQIVISVFYGPLSKFPGSKLGAAFRFVSSRHKLRGNEIYYIHQLHEKYGPIVRVGPKEVSFIDSRAWKEINGQYSGTYNGAKTGQFPKDLDFYGRGVPGYLELINANDVDHGRMRRNFSNAFSDKSLRLQEPLIRRYADQLVEILKKVAMSSENTIDIVQYLNWCTFDIMADLTSGEPLGCLQNQHPHPWVSRTFSVIQMLPFMQEINTYPLLARMVERTMPKSLKDDFLITYQYSKDFVDKRLAREDSRPDIWGIVLTAKEEYRLTKPEMYGNSKLMMSAGTETTATLLSGLIFYLMNDRHVMGKLVTEIRSSFQSPQDIDLDSLTKLDYLNACVQEGLRIYPPAAGALPRLVPKGGATVCGHYVPEHVAVYVHSYAAFHSPRNFKNPNQFVPERWLDDPEYAKDDHDVMQPFSVGPRNCIGKNLALLEVRLILAVLLWHFDFSMRPETSNWLDQKVFIVWEKPPLPVDIKLAHAA